MGTGVFHSHSVLRFPMFFSFSPQRYLGKSSIFLKALAGFLVANETCVPSSSYGWEAILSCFLLNLADVAVGPSPLLPRKGVSLFTTSSTRSNGGKEDARPRKAASKRTEKGDEDKRPQSSDRIRSKSRDQEEIIALFKRIQSSISKGDSQSTNKRSFNSFKDMPSAELILDVLFESGEQVQDKNSGEVQVKDLTKRRNMSRKEQDVPEHHQDEVTDLKLTRLPSDFVKKSPIPPPSTPAVKVLALSTEKSPTIMGDKQVQSHKLEDMKLAELKELAKSRGIKGYSKLKKVALIEILMS